LENILAHMVHILKFGFLIYKILLKLFEKIKIGLENV